MPANALRHEDPPVLIDISYLQREIFPLIPIMFQSNLNRTANTFAMDNQEAMDHTEVRAGFVFG
jgi:hypothetical protein